MLFKSNFFKENEMIEGNLMKTRGKKDPIGTVRGGYKKEAEKKWVKVKGEKDSGQSKEKTDIEFGIGGALVPIEIKGLDENGNDKKEQLMININMDLMDEPALEKIDEMRVDVKDYHGKTAIAYPFNIYKIIKKGGSKAKKIEDAFKKVINKHINLYKEDQKENK